MTPGRRATGAALLLALGLVLTFGVIAPPERCPRVTAADLRAAAGEAVDWFARNQADDGTWLYLYDARADAPASDYNVVRHAGVTMSLYQAANAGMARARESADRGTAWALDRLVRRDGWAAVRDGGDASVGATALLTAGLVERRIDTGDPRHDDLLRELGRFLVAQTEPSGAVLARYDVAGRAPVPGLYSVYYTGEAYWALTRLNRLFPDEGWGAVADRIGAYLAQRRDRAEDVWPPLPDHWAAYGLAETVAFADRAGGAGDAGRSAGAGRLTASELAYARRQAGLFGAQVRWVSQRFGPWGAAVRGPMVPRGGGYGVMGEALTGLWRVARAEPRLADLRAPLAERALCNAGLAVREQSDAAEADELAAGGGADPGRVRGAWFRDGETRMDDQQHALSALLRTEAIVEAEAIDSGRPAPSAWLWLIVLVAAVNPFRLAPGVPQGERTARQAIRVAALGGTLGAALAVGLSLTSGPLLDVLDVSRPALRIAAGVVAVLAGALALSTPAAPAEPALPGGRAALVPVAVPLVASPAVVLLALSAHADRGADVVAAGTLAGVAVLVALVAVRARRTPSAARPTPPAATSSSTPVAGAPAGPGAPGDAGGAPAPGGDPAPSASADRLLRWAARLTSAGLIAGSVLLVVDGIFDV
ncbi:MAG TPA: hypothetical protein VIL48_09745 [Acidimicrobiales bacterium]